MPKRIPPCFLPEHSKHRYNWDCCLQSSIFSFLKSFLKLLVNHLRGWAGHRQNCLKMSVKWDWAKNRKRWKHLTLEEHTSLFICWHYPQGHRTIMAGSTSRWQSRSVASAVATISLTWTRGKFLVVISKTQQTWASLPFELTQDGPPNAGDKPREETTGPWNYLGEFL